MPSFVNPKYRHFLDTEVHKQGHVVFIFTLRAKLRNVL